MASRSGGPPRYTACVSTQVGCAMNCQVCGLGRVCIYTAKSHCLRAGKNPRRQKYPRLHLFFAVWGRVGQFSLSVWASFGLKCVDNRSAFSAELTVFRSAPGEGNVISRYGREGRRLAAVHCVRVDAGRHELPGAGEYPRVRTKTLKPLKTLHLTWCTSPEVHRSPYLG
jgi:hypothetical protein